jgi:hypothetical protein
MKKVFSYFILLITLFWVSSCEKEDIDEPILNEPVFKVQGNIGTEAFSIEAGEENFFMNTFSELINGVELFSGSLSNGDFEIKMGIYNGNIDIPSSIFSQDLPEEIGFSQISNQPLATLSKNLFPNGSLIQEIKWNINGVFAGLNTVQISSPGKYNVCADVSFSDGSSSSLCNELIVGYVKNATCELRHFLSSNGNFKAWLDNDNQMISSVKWILDGVYLTNNETVNVTINGQFHLLTAEICFQNGVKRIKSMIIDGSLNGKFIDDFSVFENNNVVPPRDYGLTISVKKNGKEYLSQITANQSSSMHVHSIDYFGKNKDGKDVYKIAATISCSLKEISSGDLIPFNTSTIFGISVN